MRIWRHHIGSRQILPQPRRTRGGAQCSNYALASDHVQYHKGLGKQQKKAKYRRPAIIGLALGRLGVVVPKYNGCEAQ